MHHADALQSITAQHLLQAAQDFLKSNLVPALAGMSDLVNKKRVVRLFPDLGNGPRGEISEV